MDKRIFKARVKDVPIGKKVFKARVKKRIFKIKRTKMIVFKGKVKQGVDKRAILEDAFYTGFLDKYLSENQSPTNYIEEMLVKLEFILFKIEFNTHHYTPEEIRDMIISKIDMDVVFDILHIGSAQVGKMGLANILIKISQVNMSIFQFLHLHRFVVHAKYNLHYAISSMICVQQTYAPIRHLPYDSPGVGLRHYAIKDDTIVLATSSDLPKSLALGECTILVDIGNGRKITLSYAEYLKLYDINKFTIEHYAAPYYKFDDIDTEEMLEGYDEYSGEVDDHPYVDIMTDWFTPITYEFDSSSTLYRNNTVSHMLYRVVHFLHVYDNIININDKFIDEQPLEITEALTRVFVRFTTIDRARYMDKEEFIDTYFSFLNL